MKQRLLLTKVVLALLLLGTVASGSLYAQLIYSTQSLVANNSKLRIRVNIRNTGTVPLTFGSSDIKIELNNQALNLQGLTKVETLDGIWDDGNSPRFYNNVALIPSASLTGFFIKIVRTPTDTAVLPANIQLAVGDTATIAVAELPVVNCTDFSNLFFNPADMLINDFRGFEITPQFAYESGTISLAPAPPIAQIAVTGGILPSQPLRFCNTGQSVTVTVTGQGLTEYNFAKRDRSGDTTTLSGWVRANTFNIQSSDLNDGDSIIAYVRTVFCEYKVAGGETVNIEGPLANAPQFQNRDRLNLQRQVLCINPADQTYSIFPLSNAIGYQWEIFPESAGVIVGPSNGTDIVVNWDDAYVGQAFVRVRGINTCNPTTGAQGSFYVRIDNSRPIAPATPQFNSPLIPPTCITDRNLATISIPNVPFAEKYTWRITPSAAVVSLDSGATGDTATDRRNITVEFNRFWQGTQLRVAVVASNTCGTSDSTFVNIAVRPLPAKPVSITAANPTYSSCRRRNEEGVEFVRFNVTPSPTGTPGASTNAYRWAVRFENDGIYNPTGNARNPLLPDSANFTFRTTQPFLDFPVNKAFYGRFRVSVAVSSGDLCAFSPDPRAATFGPAFSDAAAAIGEHIDTVYLVRPYPIQAANLSPAPVSAGRVVFRSNPLGDTASFIYPQAPAGSQYFATRVRWEVKRAKVPGGFGPDPSLLGSFIPDTGRTARLTILPNAPVGDYLIYAYGVNDCGEGDTSRALRIRVSDAPGYRIDTLAYTRSAADSLFAADPYRFCSAVLATMNGGNIQFRAGRSKRDSANAAANYFNMPLYYRWEVKPAAALSAAGLSGLPNAVLDTANRVVFNYPADRADSNIINIGLNPNYLDTVTIRVYPVNGFNFRDTAMQRDSSIIIKTKIFRNPQVFAGASQPANQPVPALTLYRFGGDSRFTAPQDRTFSVFNGAANRAKLTWSATVGGTPDNDFGTYVAVDSLNPVASLKAPVSGTSAIYQVSLRVIDSVRCYTTSAPAQITVQNSCNINLRALLEGPYQVASNQMHDSLYQARLANTDRVLEAQFERRSSAVAPASIGRYMNFGTQFPDALPAGQRIVDQVRIDLLGDTSGATLVGTGYAFLTQDGSVIEYEQGGLQNFARIPVTKTLSAYTTDTTAGGYYVRISHRNHLSIVSANRVKPTFNTTPGLAEGQIGFVDMTRPSNLYRVIDEDGYGFKTIGGRAVMIGGNVINNRVSPSDARAEINAWDNHRVSRDALDNGGFVGPGYYASDANLSGTINAADRAITEANSLKLFFTTTP